MKNIRKKINKTIDYYAILLTGFYCPRYFLYLSNEKQKKENEMKSKVDLLLEKLNKNPVNNDKEFLECLMDLDDRLKVLENNKEIKQ